MLSFIYRLVRDYEREHGYPPNLLYMSEEHLEALRDSLEGNPDLDTLVDLLGMDIILSEDAVHPHVAWSHVSWRHAAV